MEDYLLDNIGSFLKKDNTPYTIYTPFKNNLLKNKIEKPKRKSIKNLTKSNLKTIDFKDISHHYNFNENIKVSGGRKNVMKILKKIKSFKDYSKTRNNLSSETTLLSAYIKFGCASIREVFWTIKSSSITDLLNQLIWREFYYYIGYYFPKVMKNQPFNEKYKDIKWRWNKKQYDSWCKGETGYPVVDAGMRELNTTGYMHNRARLITSNFLNRMLGMDWRHGELYFAKQLVDYDPLVNNGNWGWISSTGTDPKPYFQRLFNPWLQSEKFDPDCEYIKTWIPELKQVPNKEIHEWYKYYNNYTNYVKPIVEYKSARKKSVEQYRKVL